MLDKIIFCQEEEYNSNIPKSHEILNVHDSALVEIFKCLYSLYFDIVLNKFANLIRLFFFYVYCFQLSERLAKLPQTIFCSLLHLCFREIRLDMTIHVK